MESITPERFIELLKEKRSLNLYNTKEQTIIEYYGIEKGLDGSFFVHSRDYGGRTHEIDDLYESKPETPLDKLDRIIGKWGTGSEDWKYFDLITDWRKKYNSQLKELK